MIITRLSGGLGNQMFQYAAGRTLAHYHNTDLFLDLTGYASDTLRKYELDIFRINSAIASSDMLNRVPFSRKDTIYHRIRNLFKGEMEFLYVKEQGTAFMEKISTLPDNVYLSGYWQSEKYFAEIADVIKKDFSFVNPPSEINQRLLETIRGSNSVSLHIRRGDYVSSPKTREIHGVLEAEYYRYSLNFLEKKVKDPQVFIFSDDIAWAKKNLTIDLPLHFIEHNCMDKNHEDLRLMSSCRHHIIANSSFSWWGAWLSKNPNKMVIAPKKWFSDQEMKKRKKIDIIPETWIQL